jgi:hypothetical protein
MVVRWEDATIPELAERAKEWDGDFRLMVDFIALLSLPAVVKDKKGRLICLNLAARKLWKVRDDAAVGKTLAQLFENPLLDLSTKASDRRVLRDMTAHVAAHLQGKPHFFTLTFPFEDSEDDVLLGVILRMCQKCDGDKPGG